MAQSGESDVFSQSAGSLKEEVLRFSLGFMSSGGGNCNSSFCIRQFQLHLLPSVPEIPPKQAKIEEEQQRWTQTAGESSISDDSKCPQIKKSVYFSDEEELSD